MNFNLQAFFDNLYYMGIGMLGIFIVIGVIVGATMLMSYFARRMAARGGKFED